MSTSTEFLHTRLQEEQTPYTISEGSEASQSEESEINRVKSSPPEPEYPSGLKLGFTLFALLIALFCVALDSTIIATAIPRITDEFTNSLEDVGWYGSAYLLTKCAFQLPFGKGFKYFSLKWTFMTALAIFEIGSLICAVATSSGMLIGGRIIAGIGSAGISSGGLIIIATITPIEKRATYQSIYGSVFGIASVVGPLIGGVFTTDVSWRWCFYINLPLGAVSAVLVVLILHLPPKPNPLKEQSIWQLLWNFDPIGFVLFVPSIVCLLFTLEWGGITYAWNSGRIIALFVVFGVTIIAFAVSQIFLGELGTVPPRIFKQRTMFASSLFTFCLAGTFFLFSYMIPIWLQAVKGRSALDSGIDTIPLILPNVIGILVSGFGTTKIGYYIPFIYLAVIFAPIGAGLLYTMTPNTSTGRWIGYEILFGIGSGLGFQLPQVAAQTVLAPKDIAMGISVSIFFQALGGAVLISAANNVLDNTLIQKVNALDIPGVSGLDVVSAGATKYRDVVPTQYVGEVVNAYNEALVHAFEIGLIMACLAVIPALLLEWKSVKKTGPGGDSKSSTEKA